MSHGTPSRRPGRGTKLKAPKRVGMEMHHDEMWQRLSKAISQIQNHNISTLSYEEHYRYAYNLVLHKHGDMLYTGVRKQIAAHLAKQCKEHIVPAFPPGGATAAPGIVLPSMLTATSHSSGGAGSGSAKGKERATDMSSNAAAASQSETSLPDGEAAGVGSALAATQGIDRADAVARAQAGEQLLKAVRDCWDDHEACTKKLRDVLKYVDRVYVQEANVLEVYDMGLELFRDTVLLSSTFPIHAHLYTTLLTQIQIEREGSVINRSAVKSNVDMLTALSAPGKSASGKALKTGKTVYQADFEPAFLATSTEFYRAEATRLLDARDAGAFLKHVERRFQEEAGRVAVYLHNATDAPLRSILENELLARHLEVIIDMPASGLVAMLDQERLEDLLRLYTLFGRVAHGLPVLKAGIKAYIAAKGRIINDQVTAKPSAPTTAAAASAGPSGDAAPTGDEPAGAAPAAAQSKSAGKGKASAATAPDPNAASTPQAAMALKWVEDVLAFKTKFDQVLRDCFRDDKGCETAINEAFETFVNSNPRAPEFISLFIDENLKKGLKGKTEEEVDEVLNRTIMVFRFLHEKDVFERYYKAHLAKRLLHGRSVSDDAERGMMAKLKIECGHGYVQKLAGMLNDMKVSEETMKAFSESVASSNRPMPFELSVNVLTSTYWPIPAQSQTCTMGAAMMDARDAFSRFYQSRHSGRILTWHPNHGTADVRVAFKARKHELNVSTFALVVLLLFEDVASDAALSYADIAANTSIPPAELGRTLQSLACAKYKILLKEPKGREVGTQDRFFFNADFTCNLARIKIAQVAARVESAAERKETTGKVEEERKNQVEAAIVRVMKDRKTMSHNELVTEVIKQLTSRFQPSPNLVKRRIESLIDREYLERTDAMNVYVYLA